MSAVTELGNFNIYRCPDCGCDTIGGNAITGLKSAGKITWKDSKVSVELGMPGNEYIFSLAWKEERDVQCTLLSDGGLTVTKLPESSSIRTHHKTALCAKRSILCRL